MTSKTDYSCENLSLVFVPDSEEFIKQWLTSTQGHRECMTNPDLTTAGYAVTKMMLLQHGGTQTTAYVVVAIHATN